MRHNSAFLHAVAYGGDDSNSLPSHRLFLVETRHPLDQRIVRRSPRSRRHRRRRLATGHANINCHLLSKSAPRERLMTGRVRCVCVLYLSPVLGALNSPFPIDFPHPPSGRDGRNRLSLVLSRKKTILAQPSPRCDTFYIGSGAIAMTMRRKNCDGSTKVLVTMTVKGVSQFVQIRCASLWLERQTPLVCCQKCDVIAG